MSGEDLKPAHRKTRYYMAALKTASIESFTKVPAEFVTD